MLQTKFCQRSASPGKQVRDVRIGCIIDRAASWPLLPPSWKNHGTLLTQNKARVAVQAEIEIVVTRLSINPHSILRRPPPLLWSLHDIVRLPKQPENVRKKTFTVYDSRAGNTPPPLPFVNVPFSTGGGGS